MHRAIIAGWLLVCSCLTVPASFAETPLRACVTVPELGGLVTAIGGDQVTVTVFAKGTEDPHYLDARPSFIKVLSEADLYVQVGLDLEAGWAPLLLRSSRNPRVQPGRSGFIDASRVIEAMEIPSGPVDRSMGDVHPQGNPHYLTDPLNGLKVAALLRDRMSALRPDKQKYFAENFSDFRHRLGTAMVGPELAARYDFEKLALLQEHGRLQAFLQEQGDAEHLSGWLGKMIPHDGAELITYHKSWPYFARRFGLTIVAHLEPKPGIPPGPGHISQVIATIESRRIPVLLVEPWTGRQATEAVAKKTGIHVVRGATSAASGEEPYDYLAAMTTLIDQVAAGLEKLRHE